MLVANAQVPRQRADIVGMNETFTTLSKMLRLACDLVILVGCVAVGGFLGAFAGAFMGFFAGAGWAAGTACFGMAVGAAVGLRRFVPPASS